MNYQMIYPPILSYLDMLPLFFQMYATKKFQEMNLIMTYEKLVTGQPMENWLQP